MNCRRVVVVGAGHAGVQVALSLREFGYAGPVTILGKESHAPYERPPLSKACLKGDASPNDLHFRNDDVYAGMGIEVRTGVDVEHIDRQARSVQTNQGAFHYDHLVLATGAAPRQLPIPGTDIAGVCALHTIDDAHALVANLSDAKSVVVIGAGFIGLEVAAAARSKGLAVNVIEAGDRAMQRAVTPETSQFFTELHAAAGTQITFNTFATAILGANGRVREVRLADGSSIRADLVVLGVGVVPNVALAAAAGLVCDNGILVDEDLLTSDPHISAVGDCAAFPLPDGRRIRLESVQNAVDQARTVAARLTGDPAAFDQVPWFWSDQHGCKLQMVGLTAQADTRVIIGDVRAHRFSVLCWEAGVFVGGESVNRPADHVALRRLMEAPCGLTPEVAEHADFDLKSYSKLVASRS